MRNLAGSVLAGAVVCAVVLATFAGCVSVQSSPGVRFYSLSVMHSSVADKPADQLTPVSDVIVGVGPVKFPAFLNRPQIVTRKANGEITLAEFDRWIELPKDACLRIVSQNMQGLMPDSVVVAYPWSFHTKVRYQVMFEVVSMEARLNESLTMSIQWTILDGDTKGWKSSYNRVYSQPLNRSDYQTLVQAMSVILSEFSQDVVQEISQLRVPV